MVTVLTDRGAAEVKGETSNDALWLGRAEVEPAIGWSLKPEGFCQDEVCVPIPPGRNADFARADAVNVAAFWRHMDRPVLRSAAGDVWVLGDSAADRARALKDLQAPDFSLPDLAGRLHSLSEQRGRKVFLTTWASW